MGARFWVSGIVMTIVAVLLGGLVHGVLLGADYQRLPGLIRPPGDAAYYFSFILLAQALFGFALTWIYRQGVVTGKSAVGQGVRFGLAVAALATLPTYLIFYAVQPLPGTLVARQIVLQGLAVVLMGVIVALLNPAERRA